MYSGQLSSSTTPLQFFVGFWFSTIKNCINLPQKDNNRLSTPLSSSWSMDVLHSPSIGPNSTHPPLLKNWQNLSLRFDVFTSYFQSFQTQTFINQSLKLWEKKYFPIFQTKLTEFFNGNITFLNPKNALGLLFSALIEHNCLFNRMRNINGLYQDSKWEHCNYLQ